MPQAVIAHARDLEADDSILPHSHAKAQFIYASQGVMTATTDSGAFFVPPRFAVWMPAGVVHRIHARMPVAMRTLYVRRDAIVGLPDDVCVLEVSRLLRELVITAVSYSEAYRRTAPKTAS